MPTPTQALHSHKDSLTLIHPLQACKASCVQTDRQQTNAKPACPVSMALINSKLRHIYYSRRYYSLKFKESKEEMILRLTLWNNSVFFSSELKVSQVQTRVLDLGSDSKPDERKGKRALNKKLSLVIVKNVNPSIFMVSYLSQYNVDCTQ